MAVCMRLGLRHSEFTGWDRDDRDKALWFHIHEAQRCPGCGTRPEEWDPACGGDLHAYHMEPVHCRGCEVKAGAESDFERHRREYRRGTELAMRRNPREV
jgi:hypothetical protein